MDVGVAGAGKCVYGPGQAVLTQPVVARHTLFRAWENRTYGMTSAASCSHVPTALSGSKRGQHHKSRK